MNFELFTHNADTSSGSSGSPVFDSANRVLGINRGTVGSINEAVRLTNDKINWINRVRNSYIPVYRVYNKNTGEHFLTIDQAEKNSLVGMGWTNEGTAWATGHSGEAVYRLYNPNGSEHHYTTNVQEKNALMNLGWTYEKIAWYAPTSEALPIYRLYNPNQSHNNHHYTISANEKYGLVKMGWTYEGITWHGY